METVTLFKLLTVSDLKDILRLLRLPVIDKITCTLLKKFLLKF